MLLNMKFLILFLTLTLVSCTTQRNLTYFSNLGNITDNKTLMEKFPSPKIGENDLLNITIKSLSPESNVLFNNAIQTQIRNEQVENNTPKLSDGYVVDKNGFINIPGIGKINLLGLTKEEAIEKLTKIIGDKFVKDPIVNVNFLNFRITVIGEVNKPATFNISSERINILEALGLAGDMTAYGKRENVLIIRQSDGFRSTIRLNMNDQEVLNSDNYYLQKNDIIYVAPDKAKALQVSSRNINLPIYLGFASIIAIIVTRF